jgi:fructose-1,6-bisphosphatase/inositol monophosphatase family enzyme
MIDTATVERLRSLLLRAQDFIRDTVLAARVRSSSAEMSAVAAVTAADTIYAIDKISEKAIVGWFTANWPEDEPVELVAEGVEEHEPLVFPAGIAVSATRWKLIVDPIDGTRNLMYDKRPAWILSGLAPQRGAATILADIVVAAMTELPTTKQWCSDQISAISGGGLGGLRAERLNLFTGERKSVGLRPSIAENVRHGFASLVRFFPEGKTLTAQIEERLWRELGDVPPGGSPLVFDDQYLSTGGQIYELLAGHDRMLGDLRPLVFARLGLVSSLVCHPYDICTELILREAGGVIEKPFGGRLDVPLDTTSPVAWLGFANAALARKVQPVLQRVLRKELG